MGIEVILAWLAANWELILIIFMLADKVVAATVTKKDDAVLAIIKKILYCFAPTKSIVVEAPKEEGPKDQRLDYKG